MIKMGIDDSIGNQSVDVQQDPPAVEVTTSDSERRNENLRSLAQALAADDYRDYEVYIENAIEKQDPRALSKEMLAFIVANKDNVRAMNRLLATEKLPWSKIHGKYLCKNRKADEFSYDGHRFGTSIFEYKHIPFPNGSLKNLIERKTIIPKCQKYHSAKHDEFLAVLTDIDKFSPNINRIADLLLYHSEAMYSTYTVSEIVGFVAVTAVKYINAIIDKFKSRNAKLSGVNLRAFASEEASGLSKCIHLLSWLPSVKLEDFIFFTLARNSNILIETENGSSLGPDVIAKRASASSVEMFFSGNHVNPNDYYHDMMFMRSLAKFYTEWTHQQIIKLLSLPGINDKPRSVVKALLENRAVNMDGEKVALLDDFLSGNAGPVSAPASTPPETANEGLSLYIVPQNVSITLSKDDGNLKYYAETISGKPMPLVPAPNPEQVFGDLQRHFPWAERLNDIVCRQIAMNRIGRGYAFVRPLLIHGKPGVGKTRYVQFLAERMGVPFTLFGAAGNADSMLLKGTARGWSSARPSFAIETIVRNRVANPLILVDEIDKANRSPSNGSIEQYLHGVLDPGSAEKLLDECLMVPVNLSAVSWILTANHVENFPSSFLGRLISVEMPRPSGQHHETLIRGMLESLMKEYQIHESMIPGIPENLWATFVRAADNPRMLRKMMETWLGEAARQVSLQ